DLSDCRSDPLYSASPSVACDIQHHCPPHRLADRLPTSLVGSPWPAQTVRIAGAASYLITLPVDQTISASPAAESCLNRPRREQELRPVGPNVCARGIWRRDPEKH